MLNKDTTRIHSQTWLRRWGPLPAPDCYALAEQITQSISFFCTAYRHWSVVLPHPQLQGEMAREKKNAVTKIINQKLELGQTSLSDSVPLSHPLRELSPCKIQLHTFFFFSFAIFWTHLSKHIHPDLDQHWSQLRAMGCHHRAPDTLPALLQNTLLQLRF